ncbi:hypothetical protein ACQKO6_13380 [Pseudomonas monteilii]
MTKHTAEPWDLMPHGIIYGGPVQRYANGSTKSQIAMATGANFMALGEQQANARRIVACVNACAGISTDALEQGQVAPDAFRLEESRADIAEQDRDDLLGDLREAATTLRRYETLHRAKGTPDSLAKAQVNADLASRFEQTIAKATA